MYLESMPDHIIPNKNKLIEEIKQRQEQAMMMQQQALIQTPPNTPSGV